MSKMPDNISSLRASTISSYDQGQVEETGLLDYSNLFYPYLIDNGGNTNIVSLTIDVLNREDLDYGNNVPDERWVDSNRKRRQISSLDTIWGFKECSHQTKKSRSLSNAFCFDGQQLTFYIATKGHSCGYIGDQWAYGHTSLVVSALNMSNGEQETLFTFDGFEEAEDSDGRYFIWNVPPSGTDLFGKYGVFGLNVIKLEVTTSYYQDAQKDVSFSGAHPTRHQSLLQLLVYSGARELIDVNAGDADIVVHPIGGSDSLYDIFHKTTFANLEALSQSQLTSSQKRAVIADQAAVLFMSQHPVVNADQYPSKILGVGAEQAMSFTKEVDKSLSHYERYETVDMAVNRLFGMLASYRSFNFVADFEELFTDFNQSTQTLRDPLKTYCINENYELITEYGEQGIVFNPYIQELQNAEFIEAADNELVMYVDLFDGKVDIADITLTDTSGNVLESGDTKVKISFSVLYGEKEIKRIKYQLFTINTPAFYDQSDDTGTTRTHTFKLDSSLSLYERVFAKIIVEDYEGNVQVFSSTEFIQIEGDLVPAIYDLEAYQNDGGSNFVDIYYTYEGNGDINNSSLTVEYSVNGGTSWTALSSTIYGDHGYNIMPGYRHIQWDVSTDLASATSASDVMVKLTLVDVDNVTATGQTISSRITWSLDAPTVALKHLFRDELDALLEQSETSSSTSSTSSESELNYSSSSSSSSSEGTSSSSSSSVGESSSSSSSSSSSEGTSSSESVGNTSSSTSSGNDYAIPDMQIESPLPDVFQVF